MSTAEQEVQELNLKFKQGDYVRYVVRLKNFDNGATTWKAQIRRQQNPTSALVSEFDCTPTADGTDTLVELELHAADNTLAGSFHWDLEGVEDSKPRTYLAGKVTVTKQVTS